MGKIKFSLYRKEIFFAILLFVCSIWIRFYRLSETPIYPDEITWMVRAKETALAIKVKDINYFRKAWWTIGNDTEAIALPLSVVSGFPLIYLGNGQSVVSRNLVKDYIAARGSVIFFSAFFIAIYFIALRKITNIKVALLASILLSLDPIFLANSKLVMNDIFLTTFIFIALVSYFLIKNNYMSILISAIFTAFAFLSKPDGLIVIPVLLSMVFLNRKSFAKEVRKFFIYVLTVFLTITVLWPSSWSSPLFAIPEYILRETKLVSGGINNYFFGKLTDNPPAYYYLFEILVRLPPLILFSFIFAALSVAAKEKNRVIKAFYIFIFIFLCVVSFSAKKLGVRYILPIWPFIYAISVSWGVRIIEKVNRKVVEYSILLLAVIWFGFVSGRMFPYTDLYYNQFIGGSINARKYDLVGLCEGSKAAVDYLLHCYPDVKSVGAIGCGNSTIPYYYPYPYSESWRGQKAFFVEAYYIQLQKDFDLNQIFHSGRFTKRIQVNGVDLAYIYLDTGLKNKCGY